MGQMRKGFGFVSVGFETLGRHPAKRLSPLLSIPEFRRQTWSGSIGRWMVFKATGLDEI